MNKFVKYKDLCDLDAKNLNSLLLNYKKELFNIRFRKKTEQLTNVSVISILKKKVAQVKTEISRRKIEQNKGKL